MQTRLGKSDRPQAIRCLLCILCMLLYAPMAIHAIAPQELGGDTVAAFCAADAATEEPVRPLYVKTNAVAWALLITNVEVETDIRPHLSVNLGVNCSTWNYFGSQSKYRVLSFYPAIRYWLDPSNGKGAFFGAHIGMASYNFASNGKYRTQDHNGCSPAVGVGLSAGYRMAISRDGRWMAEACLGAGLYSLYYDKFYNQTDGLRASTTKRGGVCLDHLSLSLCYRFDLKKGKRP